MRKVYIGSKKQILKLYPDEGYKLTTYNENTQDILFFAWYNAVATSESRAKNYFEISNEKVAELDARKELAMRQFEEAEDGTGDY